MSPMDVEVLAEDWRKASRSVNNGACVEVGSAQAAVLIRDSVNRSGVVVKYSARSWQAFLVTTKACALDALG